MKPNNADVAAADDVATGVDETGVDETGIESAAGNDDTDRGAGDVE